MLYYLGLLLALLGGLFARPIAGWLYRRFSPPAQDWKNPANAPPAFEGVRYHVYEGAPALPCCVHCGGGELHPVHSAGYVPAPSSSRFVGESQGEMVGRFIAEAEAAGGALRYVDESGRELPGQVRGGDGFRKDSDWI